VVTTWGGGLAYLVRGGVVDFSNIKKNWRKSVPRIKRRRASEVRRRDGGKRAAAAAAAASQQSQKMRKLRRREKYGR